MQVIHSTIQYLLNSRQGFIHDKPVIVLDMNTSFYPYDQYQWDSSTTVKRILLLRDSDHKLVLAINPMGSHFTGKGKQAAYIYAGVYWDNVTSFVVQG